MSALRGLSRQLTQQFCISRPSSVLCCSPQTEKKGPLCSLLPPQPSLAAYRFSCRAEDSWYVYSGMSAVVLLQLRFGQWCWWDFMCKLWHPRRHSLTANSLILGSYSLSAPSPRDNHLIAFFFFLKKTTGRKELISHWSRNQFSCWDQGIFRAIFSMR